MQEAKDLETEVRSKFFLFLASSILYLEWPGSLSGKGRQGMAGFGALSLLLIVGECRGKPVEAPS